MQDNVRLKLSVNPQLYPLYNLNKKGGYRDKEKSQTVDSLSLGLG